MVQFFKNIKILNKTHNIRALKNVNKTLKKMKEIICKYIIIIVDFNTIIEPVVSKIQKS